MTRTIPITLMLPVGMPFEIGDALSGEVARLVDRGDMEAAMVVKSLAALADYAKAHAMSASPSFIVLTAETYPAIFAVDSTGKMIVPAPPGKDGSL